MQFQRITYKKIVLMTALFVLGGCLLVYFLTLNKVDEKIKNQPNKGGSVSISITDLQKDFVSLQQGTGSPQTGNINITGNIQASGEIQGSSLSGDSLTIDNLNGVLKADQGVVSGGATTSDVTEGTTNKYYTDARVDNRISSKTTNNITEGTNNLYYTGDRFNQSLDSQTTDNLTEGTTNQYYTDTRARDAISGSSSINYNSTTGSISLSDSGVTTGTYGDGTHVGQFTVDAQGRVTSSADVLITGAAPVGAAGGDLTGNFPNPTIKDTWGGVTGINTLGTITTGTWHGTAIQDAYIATASSWNTAYSERNQWDGGATGLVAATGRTSLGLGSLATASTINNGDWSGADLAVANGGTGASDAGTARTNLGLAIGSDVQGYNAGFADIAGIAKTDGNFIVGNGTNWVAESGATARTSLGLGSISTQASDNVSITGGSITGTTTWNAGAITSSGNIAINGGGTSSLTGNLNVNSSGFGPELVTNGTFTGSATGWGWIDNGWAYNNNTMVHSSGTGTVLGQDLSQIGSLEQNAQYKVTFTVSNIVAGSGINVNLGCGYASTYITGNGTQTLYLSAGSCGSWIVFLMNSPSSSLTLDNVSVTKVSGGALTANTVTADVLMPSSSGTSALGTPTNPWSSLTLSGGLNFVNPLQVAGTGVLMKNVNSTGGISTYSANVPSGSQLSLINLDFTNTQTTYGGSLFYGIRIITDSNVGDTAAGIAIGNNGPSDAIYINNVGRAGAGLQGTGIGLDVNRNNYGVYTGNGFLSYDFSTVNSGATIIHLAKVGNGNTTNKMIHLEGNQNAIYLQTTFLDGQGGTSPLVKIQNANNSNPFILYANGDITAQSATFTGTLTASTSVSTSSITTSGAGIALNSKNLTGVGTIASGAITSSGAIQGASLTATGLTQGSVAFIGPGGLISQDNANFLWDNTNKILRVGNTDDPLSAPNPTNGWDTFASATSNANTNAHRAGLFKAEYSGTATGGTQMGLNSFANNLSTGTVSLAIGGRYGGRNRSSGTITQINAVDTLIQNTSTGTITTANGFYASAPANSGGGLFHNWTAISIDASTVGDTSNIGIKLNGDSSLANIINTGSAIVFGAGQNAAIGYNGTDLIVNPQIVGSGVLKILGGLTSSKLTVNAPVTADALATAIVTPSVATDKGLVVQGYTAQTADLIQAQSSAGNVLFNVSSAGNVGIGISPTAVLHLKAGTAAASTAPIKLTAGTLMTTAEIGAVEYDGTKAYITLGDAVRREILVGHTGTTASIGGGALVAGACASGTTTVTGAATTMTVDTSPNTYPGDGRVWQSYVSAANTVTTKVCAIVAGTPTASTYNIRVIK